jgi:hypothetical protein
MAARQSTPTIRSLPSPIRVRRSGVAHLAAPRIIGVRRHR